MTDQPPEQHEHITRMLREQGPAQSPPGLSDDVMRQVRAEPRRRERPALRFVAVLAAAALLAVAAIAGISRLGGSGSSSSAGSAAGGGTMKALAPEAQSSGAGGATAEHNAPDDSAAKLIPYGPLQALAKVPAACPSSTYTVHVPPGAYAQVADKLKRAARSNGAQATSTSAKVTVRRDPAARRIRITCP
jgi:hypothetical protein